MWCIIPAAGIGSRMGFSKPKQYLELNNGQAIIEKTIDAVLSAETISGVVVALNQQDTEFEKLSFSNKKPVLTCIGGDSRQMSVYNGLCFLKDKVGQDDFVCVHDAARPLVDPQDIDALNQRASSLVDADGIILVAEVADTIKQVMDNQIIKTVDRSYLYRALTPQTMRYQVLFESLEYAQKHNLPITDEASALETCNYKVEVLVGSPKNIKITYPSDLELIKSLLNKK
ncbi:2-C-methyl-D-erythritol 4-phosphate cytidylyltransferase [Thiotrichales bacterium 19S11-10]|nr:2-C-methyl-D-erythritol 4-phosphate cytidylyltransferase [Thiotrichales bacterium 19S11-10]